MNKYYYDFHIHSCLSPCGDNDMTPNNICGMATLNGLNIIALTDHNTSRNCPAFFACAKKNGLIPIGGMELTTAEDIHVVCLFETLEGAMEFSGYVDSRRIKIPNRIDIFGDQLIMDENDEIIGTEEFLLPNATTISLDEVKPLVEKYGGICYPAHVDRQSNGLIAVLGTFPESPDFLFAEFNDGDNKEKYLQQYPILKSKKTLVSSDAHYLWHMRDAGPYIEIDDEDYSGDKVRHSLFCLLRGETGEGIIP